MSTVIMTQGNCYSMVMFTSSSNNTGTTDRQYFDSWLQYYYVYIHTACHISLHSTNVSFRLGPKSVKGQNILYHSNTYACTKINWTQCHLWHELNKSTPYFVLRDQ